MEGWMVGVYQGKVILASRGVDGDRLETRLG